MSKLSFFYCGDLVCEFNQDKNNPTAQNVRELAEAMGGNQMPVAESDACKKLALGDGAMQPVGPSCFSGGQKGSKQLALVDLPEEERAKKEQEEKANIAEKEQTKKGTCCSQTIR